MSILVIAEHNNQALNGATLNVVAAAQKIGGDICRAPAGALQISVVILLYWLLVQALKP